MKDNVLGDDICNDCETIIEGKNPVLELLRSRRDVDKLFISEDVFPRMGEIISLAKESKIVLVKCDRRKLDKISLTHSHQGVIAFAAAKKYVGIDDILDAARRNNQKPLIVICDGITDPHNLGAIIRSAETAGAHGVIISKRRSVGLTGIASKTSAGAIEHMNICKVTNISDAVDQLKADGVWVFCADADGDTLLYDADFKDSTAIVIGSEGRGVSRLVKSKCDFVVNIPVKGKINSLNASAASAVLLYEAVRKRL